MIIYACWMLWRRPLPLAIAEALAADALDLHTQTRKANELCRKTAAYILGDDCCPTVKSLIEGDSDSVASYCARMSRCEQEAFWAGEAELFAMSNSLDVNIVVYTAATSTTNARAEDDERHGRRIRSSGARSAAQGP